MRIPYAVAIVLSVSYPATGQPVEPPLPACDQGTVGNRMCRMGNVCVCRMTGGALMGIPQALRWDCSIANGACYAGLYERLSPLPGPRPGPVVGVAAPPRPAPTAPSAPAASHDDVRSVQVALARLGFDPGPADGVVGPRTRAAIRAYQARNGLPLDERVTPDLVRRLAVVGR
jgi:hypothetical protein